MTGFKQPVSGVGSHNHCPKLILFLKNGPIPAVDGVLVTQTPGGRMEGVENPLSYGGTPTYVYFCSKLFLIQIKFQL